MITLFVRQANQPAVEVKVPGNIARVGRAPGSELHLPQSYVSKKHLRVIKGIVIVDLGSSNGTYLDGKRIKDPVVYTGGEIRIGDGDVFMTVSLDDVAEQLTTPERPAPPAADSGEVQRLQVLQDDIARLEVELRESGQRVLELEAERAAPVEPAGPQASELEALAALDSTRAELEERRAQAAGLQEQVAALQAEAAALRSQIAALQAQPAKPVGPVSPAAELFLRLQSENSTLKRKLAELESKPPAGTSGRAPPQEGVNARLLSEIVELRAQNAALRAQAGADGSRKAQVAATKLPAPASSNVRVLFARMAKDDVERQVPLLEGPFEEFLVVEQFRLLRQVERIVTRMAGDFMQLREGNTMLPDVQGNLRALIARLGSQEEDAEVRRELLDYFAQLARWLVASLGAHRKAAESFASKLKVDLSEETLTNLAPIPVFMRIAGQREAELWRRAGLYLRELTPDMVEDRLEKFTREAAHELIGDGSPLDAAKAD